MSLADVLIWLANRGKTGLLVVQRDYVRKEITVERGQAVRASSNDPREYLGQFLVNFGLITDEQLQRAFQTQQETKVLLGRILVMIGLVAEDQVARMLEYKIAETILDALRWDHGSFTFEDREARSDRPEIEISVPLVEVHREGAARAPMWEAFSTLFPKATLSLAVVESRLPAGLKPDTFDGRVVALARSGLSIENIGLELHATDFQLYSRLYELHRLGAIEPYDHARRSPPAPQMRVAPAPPPLREPPPPPRDDFEDHATDREPLQLRSEDELLGADLHLSFDSTPAKDRDHIEDAVPVLLRPLEELLQTRSSSRERYILTRIDGQRTIGAIMQVSPMRDTEALDIFRSLSSAGLIRF